MGGDGDRMHAGPTLWVAIAALNHAKLVRNTRYLEFVLDIVDWCRSELAYFRFPDGERGGISMGMGWGPDWNKIFSTEHNVDYFSVLQMLHEIYKESPREVRRHFPPEAHRRRVAAGRDGAHRPVDQGDGVQSGDLLLPRRLQRIRRGQPADSGRHELGARRRRAGELTRRGASTSTS